MSSSAILESFIHQNYPGVALPPLWQVIYQEAIRGHHLLFRREDVERFDAAADTHDIVLEAAISDDLELIALKLIGCSELQEMVKVVDELEDDKRRALYFMYRRVLWMWRNYIKDQLN